MYFNSRLREETNVKHRATGYSEINFNSRLRKETNCAKSCIDREHARISTHASAKRRTRTAKRKVHIHNDFNSRLRKGTNIKQFLYSYHFCYFNSRLREETNRCCNNHQRIPSYFNSRLRKETNGIVRIICGNDAISTHVSARRRTLARRKNPH